MFNGPLATVKWLILLLTLWYIECYDCVATACHMNCSSSMFSLLQPSIPNDFHIQLYAMIGLLKLANKRCNAIFIGGTHLTQAIGNSRYRASLSMKQYMI